MRTRLAGYRKAVVTMALALGTVFGTVSAVWAGWNLWAIVGSAGTVDEADTNIVSLGGSESSLMSVFSQNFGGTVSVKSTAPLPATLNMRYHVDLNSADVLGLFGANLRVRYVDNGANARVVVRLKQYHSETGAISTVTEFDSDAFPAQGPSSACPLCPITGLGFQRQVGPCQGSWLLPESYAYFIDAELIKTGADGTPALGMVEVQACGS